MSNTWCEILASELPVMRAVEFGHHPGAGGVAIFLGNTRAEVSEQGRQLVWLDYEAHEELAGKQMQELIDRAKDRWPMLLRMVLLHRTGRVGIAQPSVCIVIATPHRADAFDACRFLIDELKKSVAIWKKEIWDDGNGTWVKGTPLA